MSIRRKARGAARRTCQGADWAWPAGKARARRTSILAWRRRALLVLWFAGVGVVLVRAGQLQLLEVAKWREVALRQHRTSSEVPAPRGRIVDRDGVELALTRERVRVSVAPHELRDRDEAVGLLQGVLGLSAREARRLTDPQRRWSVVPGRYPPVVRPALAGVRGIYLERELERFYPRGELARGVLGTVLDGVGRGGNRAALRGGAAGQPGP